MSLLAVLGACELKGVIFFLFAENVTIEMTRLNVSEARCVQPPRNGERVHFCSVASNLGASPLSQYRIYQPRI